MVEAIIFMSSSRFIAMVGDKKEKKNELFQLKTNWFEFLFTA